MSNALLAGNVCAENAKTRDNVQVITLRIEQGGLGMKCYALFNELSIYY